MAVTAMIDPLQWDELGAAYGRHRVVFILGVAISIRVPKPNADIDLSLARELYEHDVMAVNSIFNLDQPLTLDQAWRVWSNHRDWLAFWAVRDPSAESRKACAEALALADAKAEDFAWATEACLCSAEDGDWSGPVAVLKRIKTGMKRRHIRLVEDE
jgi:hypothetical protein